MKKKNGILVTCEVDDYGNVTVTYDDMMFVKDNIWSYQGVFSSYEIKKEKLNESPDYGLKDEVRERGKIPLSFGIVSHLLSMIRSRLL